MKFYELKKGDKLRLEDNQVAEFIKMDGMYGKWELYENGELVNDWETFGIRNELEKQGDYYIIKE